MENSQDWRYLSVRRITMIEQSLKIASKVIFQPNEVNTWVAIKGQCSIS